MSEALEQALDEILSQGRSDRSVEEEMDRVNDETNMSDLDEVAREEDDDHVDEGW